LSPENRISHNIEGVSKSVENVETLKYLRKTVKNQNYIHEKIKAD